MILSIFQVNNGKIEKCVIHLKMEKKWVNFIMPIFVSWYILAFYPTFLVFKFFLFVMVFSSLSINIFWISWNIFKWLTVSHVLPHFSQVLSFPKSAHIWKSTLSCIYSWLLALFTLPIIILKYPLLLLWYLALSRIHERFTRRLQIILSIT